MVKEFVTAKELGSVLKISDGHAYKLIRQLNKELDEKGFMTVPGKVPTRYYNERFYLYDTYEKEVVISESAER